MKSVVDYGKAIAWLEMQGRKLYGNSFRVDPSDFSIIRLLLSYFLKDEVMIQTGKINPNKGILLTGPIGCGKTSLMNLMRLFVEPKNRFIVKSCRDVSFEFIQNGYEVIHKYSKQSFQNSESKVYCFDDLGTENNLKYFGNECNVMAEILLSRYDLFIARKMITHITTNLTATDIETFYGNRVRSRMREMFNLIAFEPGIKDKRK